MENGSVGLKSTKMSAVEKTKNKLTFIREKKRRKEKEMAKPTR